ncbi:MAG: hypothetical protein HYY68_01375 [Thaumarchaeota archaeon]|nr:hypothetical protein [Nitrososphaerota archaeon]
MVHKGALAAGIAVILIGIGTASYSAAGGAVVGAIGVVVTGIGAAIRSKKTVA